MLCADSLNQDGQATFQGGFVVGEEAAVRFTPPAGSTLIRVQLLWGSGNFGEGSTEGLRVYDATGLDETGFPGTMLYDGDAAV